MANATTRSEEMQKLFVGGISPEINSEALREYFSKFGKLVVCDVLRDRLTGYGRGFGFIAFADSSVTNKVLEENHTIHGRKVEVRVAKSREESKYNEKKVFVGGLPDNCTDADLKNHFESFGNIVDFVVIRHKEHNRPRGFGYVTFDSEEAVEKVLSQNFHQLGDKRVEVKRAVPKEKKIYDHPMSYTPPICVYDAYNNMDFYRGSPVLNDFGAGYVPPYQYQYRYAPCAYPWFSPVSFNGVASESPYGLISNNIPNATRYGWISNNIVTISQPRCPVSIKFSNGASGSNQKESDSTEVRKETVEVPRVEESSSERRDTVNENEETGKKTNEVPMVVISCPGEESSSDSKGTGNENGGEM